jgi:hypothetical protein
MRWGIAPEPGESNRSLVQPDQRFLQQPNAFWANVRTIGQGCGYTVRGTGQIKLPTLAEVRAVYRKLGLTTDHIATGSELTFFGKTLFDYFGFRADVLNKQVRHLLMDADEAKDLFEQTYRDLRPRCAIPMNKQKGDKKAPAFLTGMVNMLVEANVKGEPCDYDPRELTTITRGGVPVRTLARRVDGCFPSAVNPVAVWEIKEYYYTTTFGSRVADGVYESLLDGMELEELREHEGIDVKHYLFVDSYNTWWNDGKSYLCRMIDLIHMGYVDEVIFGKETVDRIPVLAPEWLRLLKSASPTTPEDTGAGH